jgi:sterol 24-C-methyltransferase
MAIFSGATIDGITINQYQVNVGNKYNRELGLDHICKLTQGDFQKLPWNDETFDVAYAIEATCHSPDKVDTFSQVNRVLKKGGLFAGYEWIVLDKYDASNPSHVSIKEGIEEGNGLPTLATAQEVVDALQKAGFEVVEYYDANRGMHDKPQIPWYATLDGSYTLKGFRMTRMGRICTHIMVNTLEFLRIAPRGSAKVSTILNKTAIALVDGGKQEIFTPSFYFLAKKL